MIWQEYAFKISIWMLVLVVYFQVTGHKIWAMRVAYLSLVLAVVMLIWTMAQLVWGWEV